jgi:hypothetical protein
MAAAAALRPRAVTDASDIAKRAVYIKIQCGKIGNSKKVRTSQIEVDADKALLRVSKTLFDAPEFRAIKNLDSEVRRYLREKALPFDVGVHLVPWEMVEEVDDQLKAYRRRREELVESFLAVYPTLIEPFVGRLGALGSESEYPTVDFVRTRFFMEWQVLSFGVPDHLKNVSARIWREERQKAAATMREAADEIRQTLRGAMLQLVETMRDRLDTPDGKPRIFVPATKNLAEFLGTFDCRNIADDGELQKMVADARQMLAGVSPARLKDEASLRAQVRTGMDRIAAKLGTMVTTRTRKIQLEEEA